MKVNLCETRYNFISEKTICKTYLRIGPKSCIKHFGNYCTKIYGNNC